MSADESDVAADPHVTGAERGPHTSAVSSEVLERLALRHGAFDRYALEGEIDRGGQGAVVQVWDGDLRRVLAMKVLLSADKAPAGGAISPVEPRSLRRFLEEAQVTGQLDHPGIVPVHELGLDGDGRVYFTMKLVKGRTLKAILDLVARAEEGWTQTRALSVLLKVCEAMAYAHHKGIVHRDLKPANVMVGRFGEVFVMDWGLAKVLGREDTKNVAIAPPATTSDLRSVRREHGEPTDPALESPLRTMDGDVVGTPAYMPPEQASGRMQEIGPHSDVYAVGAVLYHLLAGHMPYVEPGKLLSNYDVWRLVQQGPPARLAERAPATPAELAAICERAMARDIAARYPDMGVLAADLSAYLEHRVVAAYRTGALAEARKWVERNRPLAASLMAGVLLLVGGLVASLVFKARADENAGLASRRADETAKQARIARANEQVARQQAARADEQERVATQRANDVLSLSASKDVQDLVARAETLWPAHPDLVLDYERWIDAARELLDGRPADPARGLKKRPSLDEHAAKLAELRSRATPQTEAEARAERESLPRFAPPAQKSAELGWRSAMLGLEPWPSEAALEAQLAHEALPADAEALNVLAWPLVDPEQPVYGGEMAALVLARRALDVASDVQRPGIRDTLAWALFRVGRFDEALAEVRRAKDEAGPGMATEYAFYVGQLERAIATWRGAELARRRAQHAALAAEVGRLGHALDERRTYAFEDPEARWWHVQLSQLVADLEALRDPETGLLGDTLAVPFGWGMARRHEFARTIGERSMEGVEARARWQAASLSIRASTKYGGLELAPQMGLLPIGPDAHSGLWEFAHLQTGEPALRASDGKLVLREETGLVFVLLPGGKVTLGAQASDPGGANYDPQATVDESPVHDVELSPFFLSKYEMTQGQWKRFALPNPSGLQPPAAMAPLHPVEQMSWWACQTTMERLGLSLPSEAQWEYGARGGTSSVWWSGNERESLVGAVNLADQTAARAGAPWADIKDWPELDDGYMVHAPVDELAPNPFGLHNVHGNVWEWCLDGYGNYGREAPKDPVADLAEFPWRVFRGGSFNSSAGYARAAYRNRSTPDHIASSLGLRPARAIVLRAPAASSGAEGG